MRTVPEVRSVRASDTVDVEHDGVLHGLLTDAAIGLVGAAVAIVDASGAVRYAGVGSQSIAHSDPVDDQTPFTMGSITKLATAAVICQLAAEGRIGLDDPVAEWLPEIGAIEGGEAITARHLLSHAAGLVDLWEPAASLESMSGRLSVYGLLARPGKLLSYSNPGYVYLGNLAERVTGRSWADLIRKRLIEPLKLDHILVGDEGGDHANIAPDHCIEPGTARPYLGETWPRIGQTYAPAGSTLKASVVDAARLGAALLFGRSHPDTPGVLAPETVIEMQRMHISIPGVTSPRAGWGLGWSIFDNDCGGVGHQAGTTGYILGSRQHGKLAVFLSNTSNGWLAGQALARRLVGLPPTVPTLPSKAAPRADLAGRYSSPTMSVRVINGEQAVTLTDPIDGTAVHLRQTGDDSFRGSIGGGDTDITFLRSRDDGATTHLHIFSRALPKDDPAVVT